MYQRSPRIAAAAVDSTGEPPRQERGAAAVPSVPAAEIDGKANDEEERAPRSSPGALAETKRVRNLEVETDRQQPSARQLEVVLVADLAEAAAVERRE